eukprot:1180771-Prorocentrum_minimum.AAC.2
MSRGRRTVDYLLVDGVNAGSPTRLHDKQRERVRATHGALVSKGGHPRERRAARALSPPKRCRVSGLTCGFRASGGCKGRSGAPNRVRTRGSFMCSLLYYASAHSGPYCGGSCSPGV